VNDWSVRKYRYESIVQQVEWHAKSDTLLVALYHSSIIQTLNLNPAISNLQTETIVNLKPTEKKTKNDTNIIGGNVRGKFAISPTGKRMVVTWERNDNDNNNSQYVALFAVSVAGNMTLEFKPLYCIQPVFHDNDATQSQIYAVHMIWMSADDNKRDLLCITWSNNITSFIPIYYT